MFSIDIKLKKCVIKLFWENGGILRFTPDCYKNHKFCNKAVDYYSHALAFAFDCHNVQTWVINLLILMLLQYKLFLNAIRLKKCVIKLLIFVFDSVSDQYKPQETCDKVVSEKPVMLKYCLDRCKT